MSFKGIHNNIFCLKDLKVWDNCGGKVWDNCGGTIESGGLTGKRQMSKSFN